MTRSASGMGSSSRPRLLAWAGRRRWTASGVAVLVLVLIGMAAFAVYEGDLGDVLGDWLGLIRPVLRGSGAVGAYLLLYLEESGVPMPMPGDVFVMYVGHHVSHYFATLVLGWLALIVVVLLGATNLYFISRRWGRALVDRRLAVVLHLTPDRMARAETWFDRWGMWALIVGRHIPGLRVPLTVGAGIFGVGYRTFAFSVVISTAIWAGFFITLGAVYGGRVSHLLNLHRSLYVLVPLAVVLAWGSYIVYRVWKTRQPA